MRPARSVALGIILAFNFGGKPVYVMPLVFGGVPVVNTFVSVIQQGTMGQIGPVFIAGLILVAVGAIVVLVFAPRGHAPAPVAEKSPPTKGRRQARKAASRPETACPWHTLPAYVPRRCPNHSICRRGQYVNLRSVHSGSSQAARSVNSATVVPCGISSTRPRSDVRKIGQIAFHFVAIGRRVDRRI